MQVIVISYKRLKYLKQTVESLRQDDIELFIVDGGSDFETKQYIMGAADKYLLFEDNPGADFLKTEGIKKFITDPVFMLSSDDLVYPKGYSKLLLEQYEKIRVIGQYTFMACNMPYIEAQKDIVWQKVNGVEIYPVDTSQVAGLS